MKPNPLLYFILYILLSVVVGITSAYAQICNSQKASMCMEALDSNDMVIDEDSNFQNTRSVLMNFKEIPYGKAVINKLKLHNTGNADVLAISSNSARSFPWAYLNIEGTDYVSIPSDYIWSLYSSSGLVIPFGYEKIFDVTFAPVPGYELSGMQSHIFQQWNPYDVRLSSMAFEVTVTGSVNQSLGKKFQVDLNEFNGGSEVTITPDMANVNLEDNEYLLVYFEIAQKDGNPYKEVVVLHEDEDSILSKSLISGQVDNSGDMAAYSHRQFDNGNLLLRSRDTKNETKTKYWLLFKTADPIILKCHKRTIASTGSGYDTSGAAEADLKFIYADLEGNRIEEPKGVYATDNSTVGNRKPNTPSNPSPVDNVSPGNLELTWSGGDPDGDIVSYTVYLSTSIESLQFDQNATIQNSTTFYAGYLTPNTYYWKVVAKDSYGLTTSGPVWDFTVIDNSVEKASVEFYYDNTLLSDRVLNLKNVMGKSAVVEVRINPSYNSGILKFDIESSDSASVVLNSESLIFSNGVTSSSFEMTVNSLETDLVTLSFKTDIQTYKENGEPYQLTITRNNNPPDKPTEEQSKVTSNSAQLTWECSDPDNDSLIYTVSYGESPTQLTEAQPAMDKTIQLLSLVANTTYYWRVTVTDGISTVMGDLMSFTTTGNTAPDVPKNSFPEDKSIISVLTTKLSWGAATDLDDDLLNYSVKYGKSKDFLDISVDSGTETSVELTGLDDNTTYYWQVTVTDGINPDVLGDIWCFTTGVRAPDGMQLIETDRDSVKLDPVTPSSKNLLGQPLAVGDLDKVLKLSYSYPAYTSAVDIYIMVGYKNTAFFVTTVDNGINIEFTIEPKPLFVNSSCAHSGTIFSIPNELLRQLDLTGEYTFYSGVFPTGTFGIDKYDITYFSIAVAN